MHALGKPIEIFFCLLIWRVMEASSAVSALLATSIVAKLDIQLFGHSYIWATPPLGKLSLELCP